MWHQKVTKRTRTKSIQSQFVVETPLKRGSVFLLHRNPLQHSSLWHSSYCTFRWALSVGLSDWIPANSNLIPEDVLSSFRLGRVLRHSVPLGFSISGRIFLHLIKYGQRKVIVVRCYVSVDGECVTISTQSCSLSLTPSSSSNWNLSPPSVPVS